MKNTLYKAVETKQPAGVLALTNTFGIAIFDLCGDECIAAWQGLDKYTGAHRHKIHYSTAGRPYIRKGSGRYYLDEFMRVA